MLTFFFYSKLRFMKKRDILRILPLGFYQPKKKKYFYVVKLNIISFRQIISIYTNNNSKNDAKKKLYKKRETFNLILMREVLFVSSMTIYL